MNEYILIRNIPQEVCEVLLIINVSRHDETLGMTSILKCLTKTMHSTKLTS